jgi:thioredoxin reductase (NADPH)
MTETYDVIIVGAGPAGMAAAIYTGRARLKTLILEKGMPGGQILLTDFVENYPGFPEGVVPFELMDNFRKHAEKFGAKIETDEVKEIRKEGELWHVVGNKGEYPGRAVIIATGSSYRKLGLPEEVELTGRGISYCGTCDGAFFKDREVAVVGGGDHALTEALFLTKFCTSVKVIHRRDEFRGEKIIQERIFANEKIEVLWDSVIEEIKGKDKLESISMDPNTSFVKGLVEVDEMEQIKVSQKMTTSQPGIFAAGDVTNACPEQMATAVGTGVAAALAVDEYLSRQATQ